MKGQPNNSFNPTLASGSFIIKLGGFWYVIADALAWSAEFGRSVLHVARVSRSGRIEGGEMKDLDGLRELTHHMQWADALVWAAALSNSEAADDLALRGKLFHTHMVQRAFLSVWQAGPLVPPPSDPPDLLTTLESALEYYSDLGAFFSVLGEDELERPVSLPWAIRPAPRPRPRDPIACGDDSSGGDAQHLPSWASQREVARTRHRAAADRLYRVGMVWAA
jgi:hypothetical protein